MTGPGPLHPGPEPALDRSTSGAVPPAHRAESVRVWDGLTPPYATIVADPPWKFDADTITTNGEVRAGQIIRKPKLDGSLDAGVAGRYGRMSMDELRALPVTDLAAKNAHLYLWTINAFMVEAHQLARAWGFTPKTILTWVKTRHDDPSKVSMKTGYYFRGSTEHVMFAVRGKQPLLVREGVPTAFLWPRIMRHSVKPEAFMDLVERVSPGPRLELFARRKRPGWDGWGDEYPPCTRSGDEHG